MKLVDTITGNSIDENRIASYINDFFVDIEQ